MSTCRVCNVPIRWGVDEAGNQVPIDEHEQRDYGSGRYRIVRDGTRPLVAPVSEDSAARTYIDHRVICQQPRAI